MVFEKRMEQRSKPKTYLNCLLVHSALMCAEGSSLGCIGYVGPLWALVNVCCGVWTAVVPVPVVSWACQPEGEGIFCVLTCEGDTSGAEPVDYSWASCRDWDCHQQPNISNEGDAHAHAQTINVTMVNEMQ